jgi:bifunctional non-homologous end joining protein LigD
MFGELESGIWIWLIAPCVRDWLKSSKAPPLGVDIGRSAFGGKPDILCSFHRVPRIVDTFARLPASSVTLDGEGVACDPNGVTNFELLRAALGRPAKREVFLYAFDLLELDGRDMRREPWSDRRWRLARLLRGSGHGVQLSDHMEGSDGDAAFRHACAMGLEGIVAKRRDKPYRSGRSPDWIKVKNLDAPAVTRLIEGSNDEPVLHQP